MDFALSEEQIQIKNMARSFMRDEKSKEKQVENWIKNADKTKKFPVEFMKEAAKLGLLSIDIPEEYGGAGLDRVSALLAFEEIAYVSVPFSLDILVHNSLSAFAINLAGRKDQKEKYLPRMASGEIFGCFANTEPDAGADAKNIKTRAVKNGNKWLLNGKKRFCTNASASKVAVVFARTSERKAGSPGTTAFLIDIGPRVKGYSLDRLEPKICQAGSTLCEFSLNDYEASDENVLGEVDKGWNVCGGTFEHSRIWIAMQGDSLAQHAHDEIMKYASERTTFGKPVIENQYIAFELAKLKIEIESAKMMAYKAAWQEMTSNPEFAVTASMAKYMGGELAVKATRLACQYAGGISISQESIFSKLYADALAIPIYEGASEIQLAIIAKNMKSRSALT